MSRYRPSSWASRASEYSLVGLALNEGCPATRTVPDSFKNRADGPVEGFRECDHEVAFGVSTVRVDLRRIPMQVAGELGSAPTARRPCEIDQPVKAFGTGLSWRHDLPVLQSGRLARPVHMFRYAHSATAFQNR